MCDPAMMLKSIVLTVFLLGLSCASNFDTAAMLAAVNAARQQAGKGTICYSSKLMTSAQKHSDHQAQINEMTHNGPEPLGSRFTNQGFNYLGVAENVAALGNNNVDDVMKMWMNSAGHKANIIGDYTHFGVGVTKSGTKYYWTQHFAKAKDASEPCSNGSSPPTSGSPPAAPNQQPMAPTGEQGTAPPAPVPPMQPEGQPPGNQQPMSPPNGSGAPQPNMDNQPPPPADICVGGTCYAVISNPFGEGFIPTPPPANVNVPNGPVVVS